MTSLKGNISSTQSLSGGSAINVAVTPNIEVGTVTTLEPNSNATVELDETSTRMNPIFNFGIPKGLTYEITEEDYNEIETNVKSDIQPILENIEEIAETAESIAKGANQALSFGNYATMISVFNELSNDIYRTGQNILIVTLNVPDLWISEVLQENTTYTYTTDEDFANTLKEQGYVQVGYYKLSALETQKVDLTDYVKNTDYATNSKAGIIKVKASLGTFMDNDTIVINSATDNDIDAKKSKNLPIVPANLDYAVKSVGDGYYVKNTDYATYSDYGLVKIGSTYYGLEIRADGTIGLNKPSNNEIDRRYGRKAILTEQLDYAVGSVLPVMTQAEYDALETKDENLYYFIVEE